MPKPLALVILDGFGYSPNPYYNAIAKAHTPFMEQLLHNYPHTLLKASGIFVGLPDHMQGNSEVGHITIGAGRIVQQPLSIILDAIQTKEFFNNKTLLNSFDQLKQNGNSLHIMGLLSDAGVHCHSDIIFACIQAACRAGIKHIIVHPFLDGRDSPPQSAHHYLQQLQDYIKLFHHVKIGSLHGRLYAMDRDHNWDRTEKSYRVLTEMYGKEPVSWEKILEKNYAHNITDEFIEPTQLIPDCTVKNGDGIIFCNIRPDRARQLTASFVQPHFSPFITKPVQLDFFITPFEYDTHLATVSLFQRPVINNTLKDVLAQHNKTIFSIAETEKYAHVTYFFRGENEEAVSTETQQLIPSLKIPSYAHAPHMSAQHITDAVVHSLQTNPYDFYLINYANADMVGHSGDFYATVKAIEFLDKQLTQIHNMLVTEMNGTLLITADHGKAEKMFDEATQQPWTYHTTNPVPFMVIDKKHEGAPLRLPLSQLSDIAPFILQQMELSVPDEMKITKNYG